MTSHEADRQRLAYSLILLLAPPHTCVRSRTTTAWQPRRGFPHIRCSLAEVRCSAYRPLAATRTRSPKTGPMR